MLGGQRVANGHSALRTSTPNLTHQMSSSSPSSTSTSSSSSSSSSSSTSSVNIPTPKSSRTTLHSSPSLSHTASPSRSTSNSATASQSNMTGALDVVRSSIIAALQNFQQTGSKQEYMKIVQLLNASLNSPETLSLWFVALSHCTSLITSSCNELIKVIFSYDFSGDDELHECFERLVVHLVSSNAPLLENVLAYFVRQMLVNHKLDDGQHDFNRTRESMQFVHRGLARVIGVAPMAPTTLFRLIRDSYPHKLHSLESHEIYLTAILTLAGYCPVLQDRIIALVIDKLIQIDAEIRLEDAPEEDELLFSVELDGIGGGNSNAAAVAAHQADMASKLDMMMDRMFVYIDTCCQSQSPEELSANGVQPIDFSTGDLQQHDTAQTELMFRTLLKVFDCAILHTHRIKYTQFLLFYICRLNASLATQFLGYLIKTGVESTHHSETRQAALAYAGSYLARANYIPPATVRSIVKAMIDWALVYIERNPSPANTAVPAEPQQHAVFYSVCQAVFYICCFRFADVVDLACPTSLASIGMIPVITCGLNPFKFCSRVVIREFRRIVLRADQRLPIEEIISRNKRIFAPPLAGSEQLDSFFPFDPFLLKNSVRFIAPLYIHWHSMHEEPEGSDSEEESEGDDDESDSDESEAASSLNEQLSDSYPHGISSVDDEEGMHLEDLMSMTPDVSYDLDFHFSNAAR